MYALICFIYIRLLRVRPQSIRSLHVTDSFHTSQLTFTPTSRHSHSHLMERTLRMCSNSNQFRSQQQHPLRTICACCSRLYLCVFRGRKKTHTHTTPLCERLQQMICHGTRKTRTAEQQTHDQPAAAVSDWTARTGTGTRLL